MKPLRIEIMGTAANDRKLLHDNFRIEDHQVEREAA